MTAAWLAGKLLAFDLETTGRDPEDARIVTAACIECGPGGAVPRGTWLVNPGVPIPPEATALHGVTDAIAAIGWDPMEAVHAISERLFEAWKFSLPIVAMNAAYDLTLLARERQRLGLEPMRLGPVLDPLVIDRGCDKYRSGARKLADLAAHYGVKQDGPHSAEGDALTAARIVWRQARRYPLIAELTPVEMQIKQRAWHREWAEHLQEYLRSQGKADVIDPSWPLRQPQTRKEAA